MKKKPFMQVLIASSPKMGNNWLSLLLARMYHIPQITIHPGTDRGKRYRWILNPERIEIPRDGFVGHEHLYPNDSLVSQLVDSGVNVITMLRHPADAFVSLYHYVNRETDLPEIEINGLLAGKDINDESVHLFLEKYFYPVIIGPSLRWLESGVAIPVRYEDLKVDIKSTLTELTEKLAPVPEERIDEAIEFCSIENMRTLTKGLETLCRKGAVGEWREVLNERHLELMRRYTDDIAKMGYGIDPSHRISKRKQYKSKGGNMAKKVLLVNPALAYSSWRADLDKPSPDSLFIRLGLAYISSALKSRGHEVSLADLRTLSGWSEYAAMVEEVSPDFVGISIHSVEFSVAVEAARVAKEVLPGVKTVAGGVHPTMFPRDCLDAEVFDYVLQGEGEVSFPLLVEDPSRFPKVFWGETSDLDAIPFPDRELWPDFEKRMYSEPFGISSFKFPLPMVEMINVRGCPYNCSFCCGPGEHQLYTKLNRAGKRIPYIRGRSVKNVISELEVLIERYGIRSVMFHDDQFIVSPKWVSEFVDELHNRGIVKYGLKWITSSRADIICRNDELLGRMAEAGLALLIVGFESFSPRILKWFNKRVTAEQNFKAAEICHKHGIKLWANYILGIPTDTGWHMEDDLMTVEGVIRVDPVHYSPAFYTPVPGSVLYDFYKNNDLIIGNEDNERLSNRGAMAPKVKGVDYDFLQSIMIDDTVL
ncbi:MAG: radical SAM protein [Nitrospirae bacterium]|nr:radical SAM protein [Nitrospirota bacterium]